MISQRNYVLGHKTPWNYWNKKLIFFQKKINVATKKGYSKEIHKLQQFLLQSTCLLWLASNILTRYNTNEINQSPHLTLQQIYDTIDNLTQYEKKKQEMVSNQPIVLLPAQFRACAETNVSPFILNLNRGMGDALFCLQKLRRLGFFSMGLLPVQGSKLLVQKGQKTFFKLFCPCVSNIIVYNMIHLIISPVYKLQTKNATRQTKQSTFGLNQQCWKQQRQIIKKLTQNLKQPHKQIIQVKLNFKPLNDVVDPTQSRCHQPFDPYIQNLDSRGSLWEFRAAQFKQNKQGEQSFCASKSFTNYMKIKQSNGDFQPLNFAVKCKHKAQTQNQINKISNQLDATRLSHFIVFSLKAKSCFYEILRDCHCNNQTNATVFNFVSQIIINQIKQINQGIMSFAPKKTFDLDLVSSMPFAPHGYKVMPAPKSPLRGIAARAKQARANKVKQTKQIKRNSNRQESKHVKHIVLGYDLPVLPFEKANTCFCIRDMLPNFGLTFAQLFKLLSMVPPFWRGYLTQKQRTHFSDFLHKNPFSSEKVGFCLFLKSDKVVLTKEGKRHFLENNNCFFSKKKKQNKILLLVASEKVFQMEQQLFYCLFKLGYVTNTKTIRIINPILGFELLGWSFYINQQTKKVICLPSKTNLGQLKQKIKQTMKNKRYSLNKRLNKTHYLIWKWQNYHKFCYSKKKQLYTTRLWIINFIKKQSKMNAHMRSKTLKKIFS